MSYLDSAMSLAASAGYEKDRNRLSKEPSIRHSLRVMLAMSNEEQMASALLHDIFEKNGFDHGLLVENHIPECVIEAVQRMTWHPELDWDNYVEAIRSNPLACLVKRADIQDHFESVVNDPLSAADGMGIERLESLWNSLYESAAA